MAVRPGRIPNNYIAHRYGRGSVCHCKTWPVLLRSGTGTLTFTNQRRALSANVQSRPCCGFAVIFLLLQTFPRKSILRSRIGYHEIGVKLLAVESIEPLGDRALELQEFPLGTDLALILQKQIRVAQRYSPSAPSSLERFRSKVPNGRWPTFRAVSRIKQSENPNAGRLRYCSSAAATLSDS
jgi:hypothetical protein